MILLNDPRVREVPLRETGEPMVSVDGLDPRIAVDWSRSEIASTSDRFCLAREGVARMLVRAADLLPRGTRLLIKEVYRPYSRQVRSFEEGIESYRQANPGLDGEAVRELACQYVAPPEVAGHPTGGAVDAVLVRDGAGDGGRRFRQSPGGVVALVLRRPVLGPHHRAPRALRSARGRLRDLRPVADPGRPRPQAGPSPGSSGRASLHWTAWPA
ncbi:hypothetical protein [Schaalia naturae]